jgi:hypothetical protein
MGVVFVLGGGKVVLHFFHCKTACLWITINISLVRLTRP